MLGASFVVCHLSKNFSADDVYGENLKSSCLLPFSRLIAGRSIAASINITIFVHVLAQRFKRMIFHLKLPEGWIFSKVKTSDTVNGSLNLAET